MSMSGTQAILHRPGGRLAYDVVGSGPLVVCTPGMGDLRSTFRDLVPALTAAGYRVASMDLRGHGDSDPTFTEHGDVVTGQDILALVEDLGAPAVLVGSSMGAAASVWAAAERPDLVSALVLLGPFVRDAPGPAWRALLQRELIRGALLRPWGPAAWAAAYRRFMVGSGDATPAPTPPWFAEHVQRIRRSLRDPKRLRSLRSLVGQLTHRPVEERLDDVRAPSLVIMGSRDPDFADPPAELAYIQRRLGRTGHPAPGVLVPGVGHYPHAQRPDVVAAHIVRFLAEVPNAPVPDAPSLDHPTSPDEETSPGRGGHA